MVQIDGAVARINDEVVTLAGVDIEIGSSFADFQFRVFSAGIVQREPGELDTGIGCETDRAAIFEFDLCTAVILC
jgi:hypothetical protein